MKKLIDFNYKRLEDSSFKEDSVREEIILPILHSLGYKEEGIERSKELEHPFLKVGSKTKRKLSLIPDYILKVEGIYAWVLDAKSPKQDIASDDNVGQVYSYAMHPEIRTKFFALCNGKQFILYRTNNSKPSLHFYIKDIEDNWDRLKDLLSSESFQKATPPPFTGR